jgi:hypothetical protein
VHHFNCLYKPINSKEEEERWKKRFILRPIARNRGIRYCVQKKGARNKKKKLV